MPEETLTPVVGSTPVPTEPQIKSVNDFLQMDGESFLKQVDSTPAEWTRTGSAGEKIRPDAPPAAPKAPEATPTPSGKETPATGQPDGKAKGPEAQPEEKQDAEGYFQDEKGAWHRPDGKFANADEVAAISAVEKGLEEVPADTPPAPTLTPEQREVLVKERGFDAVAADGTPVDEVPNLTVQFTADGKDRAVDIPQLVRLAKMGYYNERREEEVAQTKNLSAQTYQENQQLRDQLQHQAMLIEQYMADPNIREAAAQEYARLNSPEVRLQRLQQQRVQEQQQQQMTERQNAAIGYITQSLTPRIEAIKAQYPQVTDEEILGRTSLLTGDLTVNGVVPLEYLPEVERRIEADLRPWAEQRHLSREEATQRVQTNARKLVEAAKVQTLMAKRQVARAATGVGNGQVAPNSPPTPAPAKSADAWLEQMFGKPPE